MRRPLPAWVGYVTGAVIEAALTGLLLLIQPYLPLAQFPIPYVLVIMLIAYLFGEGPAVLAFFVGLILFDYFFVPPFHTSIPHVETPMGWAALIAYLMGTSIVAFATIAMRRSQRRIQRLVSDLEKEIEDRKRAEEALRESETRLRATLQSTIDEIWIIDTEARFVLVSDSVREHLGVNVGAWPDLSAALEQLEVLLPDGTPRPKEAAPLLRSLRGEVIRNDEEMVRNLATGELRWREASSAPIRDSNGNIIGAVAVVRDITDRKLAMEALERERRRIAAMESLSEAALAAGSFDEVLQTIAVKVREGMNSHSSTLFLLDEEKNELEAVAACNVPEVIGFRIRVGEGFAGKILQEKRTIYIRDAEHDPLVTDPHIKRAGIRSLLGTPLIGRRGAVGVAYVNMEVIHEYTQEDGLLLEDLASRTALIIENARLVEEISRNYALLQRALLPARLPEFPGYAITSAYLPVPQAEVGGDFYDFFMTEKGKIAILIGDVSGKGIPSASLAAATRSTVRAFAYDISSPDQALSHANAVLKGAKDDPSLFVTVLLVTLDSAGRTCYASAGHPPPALYRAQTGEVRFLTEAGLLLGVVDQYDYEESECYLDSGDKLILYTDGLVEARHDSVMFGEEGIERVLKEYGQRSPDEVVQALVQGSTEWAGGRRTDDMAVIVIERE